MVEKISETVNKINPLKNVSDKTKWGFYGNLGGGAGIYGYRAEIKGVLTHLYTMTPIPDAYVENYITLSTDAVLVIGTAIGGLILSYMVTETKQTN